MIAAAEFEVPASQRSTATGQKRVRHCSIVELPTRDCRNRGSCCCEDGTLSRAPGTDLARSSSRCL